MKLQTLQCSQCGATVDAASIQGKVASCAFCDARFIVGSGEVRELSSYSLPGNESPVTSIFAWGDFVPETRQVFGQKS